MVSVRGRVVLMDLGIARVLDGPQYTSKSIVMLSPESAAPEQIAVDLNRQLAQMEGPRRLVTAFCARLDEATRQLTFTNAGHNPPLLVKRDGRVLPLSSGGLVLGAFADASYESERVAFEPGDRLVLYTDGVERPGDPADLVALRLVREHGADRADMMAERFADAMRSGSDGNADDLAVVVLTVSPKASIGGRMRDIVHRLGAV